MSNFTIDDNTLINSINSKVKTLKIFLLIIILKNL